MLFTQFKKASLAAALMGSAFLAGCATQESAPLYRWGGYQTEVYTYFKADGASTEEQLVVLETNLQNAEQAGQALPPGYRAHMGLLYASNGQMNQFKQALEAEKAHFPESSPFMDFLLNNFAKLQNEGQK